MFHADCGFAITASGEASIYRLVLNISYHQNLTDSEVLTAATLNSTNNPVDTVVTVRNQQMEQVSVLNCQWQIASLEVYRGRKLSIPISHDGFSLNNRKTIEVINLSYNYYSCSSFCYQINHTRLAYGIGEFKGELYRMNLSCSNVSEVSESRLCLFFKVAGVTSIEYRKK